MAKTLQSIKFVVNEKIEQKTSFKVWLKAADGGQFSMLYVPSETFNRLHIGDELELSLQFIPQPTPSTELEAVGHV